MHLKLIRGMRGTPLAYVVWHHIKVAYIMPGCGAYLNLDKDMTMRAHIVDSKMNLKMTQDNLDRIYLSYQCDAFKIDYAMVHQTLLKMFTDAYACVYVKLRKAMQESQAVFFDIHKLNLRRVMSRLWRERSPRNQHGGETETILL